MINCSLFCDLLDRSVVWPSVLLLVDLVCVLLFGADSEVCLAYLVVEGATLGWDCYLQVYHV